MARVRGRVTTKTGADVQLDTSDEHPALTPVMRRVAGEYWEIVKAKAAEQSAPHRQGMAEPVRGQRGDARGVPRRAHGCS